MANDITPYPVGIPGLPPRLRPATHTQNTEGHTRISPVTIKSDDDDSLLPSGGERVCAGLDMIAEADKGLRSKGVDACGRSPTWLGAGLPCFGFEMRTAIQWIELP